ncbi:hypothetical protein [Methanobrevibacter filiformis]|uniref:Uncharacterized protein n=1 Tax=Methanobrevibacter filiformis TaxID=55758 RepID=A0A166C3W1_9EURY|nr:hypothetical protein [Methanobrevibacter filiformis]KZX14102.1 hypothetical protein MBFIL_09340 [Methanobrevibacter filiformis]
MDNDNELNFLLDFKVNNEFENQELETTSKKSVLKFLSQIGVDTRFISFHQQKIYINNIRFSKFSKKKQEIFIKRFKEIAIIKSSLFQKIANKSSKTLSNSLNINDTILVPISSNLGKIAYILLEPYTRKYGVKLICFDEDEVNDIHINRVVSLLTLNQKAENILSDIFKGNGVVESLKSDDEKFIYPFINIDEKQLNDFISEYFFKLDESYEEKHDEIAISFMNFIECIIPQYKENILKSVKYLNK